MNSFSGKYEAILYKLCKDYVGVQRTPYMNISVFREYMGLTETEYSAFKNLNKFVISGPLKKINKSNLSDIEIEVSFSKKGRRVVGVQFLVTRKYQMGFGFGDDPAFAAAKVTISLAQQQKYLADWPSEEIILAINRANIYADDQEKKATPWISGRYIIRQLLKDGASNIKPNLLMNLESSKKNAKLNSKEKKMNTREQKLNRTEICCVRKQNRNSRCSISEKKGV